MLPRIGLVSGSALTATNASWIVQDDIVAGLVEGLSCLVKTPFFDAIEL